MAGTCTGVAGPDPWTLIITKSLTVEGGYSTADTETWLIPDPVEHPTVLDAQSLGGVVYMSGSSDITLRYLTFTGGRRSSTAGLYASSGTRVNVEYCTISGNQATGYDGGGLTAAAGSTVTIAGSLIQNNSAGRIGGGAYAAGGPLTLLNNTIIGNSAARGGAVGSLGRHP